MARLLELIGWRRPQQPVPVSRVRMTVAVIAGVAAFVLIAVVMHLIGF